MVIFLISFIIRVYKLGSAYPGLYADELVGLLSAYMQYHHIVTPIVSSGMIISTYNIRDFLYYSLTGYTMSIALFNATPFSARFPFALYGSLIIFPIYLIANKLFRNRYIGIISSFLWSISPSAVVTSMNGDGVEIFPLFFFLFFVYFWLEFLDRRRMMYLLPSVAFAIPVVYFQTMMVWGLIPLISFIVFTSIPFLWLRIRERMGKGTHLRGAYTGSIYAFSFLVSLIVIWASLSLGPSIVGSSYFSTHIMSTAFLLTSEPLSRSIPEFFIRMGTILSPWKMFWFDEFTSVGLNYSSKVQVPMMMLFTLPFLYVSVFLLPALRRKYNEMLRAYCILIVTAILGILVSVFNLAVPTSDIEPSEAIFALPFLLILASFSIFYFFKIMTYWYSIQRKEGHSNQTTRQYSRIHLGRINKKYVALILVVVFFLFAEINVVSFTTDLYSNSIEYYEINASSMTYPFYGLYQATTFMVDHGLYDRPIYYVQGTDGSYNLTNGNNFGYWFFYFHFPLYWLYVYSDGKITDVYPLGQGSLPPSSEYRCIVLTQYSNYTAVLKRAGYSYSDIYTVYRANGEPAIAILEVNAR